MAMAPSCINLQLSWEPLKLLTSSSTCSSDIIATLELSDADMIYDYYNSVLLFYDVGHDTPRSRPEHVAAAEPPPMMPLQRALQEMLAHYPCAAGLLVYNESAGRLEVRYPVCSSQQLSDISHIIADAPDQSSHPPAASYGVHFHVAHANVALADLGDVSCPQPSLDVLYPDKPAAQHLDSKGRPLPRFVMAFQVTTFKCGGITIGHTCSHAYADGYTAAVFLQNLCSIARGAGMAKSLRVTPSRRTIIRSREPPSPTMTHSYVKAQKQTEHQHLHYGTATRFRFSMNALEALRASISIPGQFKRCSRNRALVALLWTACARVSLKVGRLPGNHELNLRIPMNLRTRGFSMDYMGNAVCQLSVPATLQELCENPLAYVVDKIEKTMESLDLGGSFQSMVDYVELLHRDGLSPCLRDLGMPSLVGLPFYDTDCGWGPPMYVARPSQQLSDRCIILDHPIVGAWNVLVVFASTQEHACFQESIAMYIRKDF